MEDRLRRRSTLRRVPAPPPSHLGASLCLIWVLFLVVTLIAPLLTGCAPDAQSTAHTNKAKLDAELHAASTQAGVPARRAPFP